MAKIIDIDVLKRKKMRRFEKETFSELAGNIVEMLERNGNGAQYTPKQAAMIADKILEKASSLGYENDSSTPLIKIINGFGIDIRRSKNMPKDLAGVIYAGGKTAEVYKVNTVIFTDSNEPFEHQRFVMAHELGHYLFDYVGNPVNRKASNEIRTFEETYPRKNHSSEKEVRANRFAAELLMPLHLFVEQYNQAMGECSNRLYTIKYLARYFQVKETSVEKRIHEVLYGGGY